MVEHEVELDCFPVNVPVEIEKHGLGAAHIECPDHLQNTDHSTTSCVRSTVSRFCTTTLPAGMSPLMTQPAPTTQ